MYEYDYERFQLQAGRFCVVVNLSNTSKYLEQTKPSLFPLETS